MNIDVVKVGKFIAQIRKEKNLTQVELGKLVGTSDKTISKWENGGGLPDLVYHKPLCEALDIEYQELLSGEYDMDKRNKDRKKRKHQTIFVVFLIIMIPFFLFLLGYFIVHVNGYKIYQIRNAEVDNNSNVYIRGAYVEKTGKDYIFISNLKIYDEDILETDSLSIDIYADNKLIYHSYDIGESIFEIDKKVHLKNVVAKISVTSIDDVVNEFEVPLLFINVENYDSIFVDDSVLANNIASDEVIVERLQKEGYVFEEDKWIKEVKNKKDTIKIIFDLKAQKIKITERGNNYFNNYVYLYTIDTLEVNIFQTNNKLRTIVEKYKYQYQNEKINCQTSSCTSVNKALEFVEKYRTLLFVES